MITFKRKRPPPQVHVVHDARIASIVESGFCQFAARKRETSHSSRAIAVQLAGICLVAAAAAAAASTIGAEAQFIASDRQLGTAEDRERERERERELRRVQEV